MQQQRPSLLKKYLRNLSAENSRKSNHPLINHPYLPYMLDILERKYQHHILLQSHSQKLLNAFLGSFAFYIATEAVGEKIRHAHLIYFDLKQLSITNENSIQFTNDLLNLCNQLEKSNHLIIFIINDYLFSQEYIEQQTTLGTIIPLLKSKLYEASWRLITINDATPISPPADLFSVLQLEEPTQADILMVLKSYSEELEQFHHVTIPDELFYYALSLSKHYLGGKSNLDACIKLLDSAAAKVAVANPTNTSTPCKLSAKNLTEVVSHFTSIPLPYLNHNKFKLNSFVTYIQQKIIGQDIAINTIGSLLQATCLKFKEQARSVFGLLLTGPSGVGKKEFAFALAEYLFASKEALLHVPLHNQSTVSCLSDIFALIHSERIQSLPLLSAVKSKPYAIIFLENCNESAQSTLKLFNEIFMYGYAIDNKGNYFDFSHTIILISTTLGAESLTKAVRQNTEANPIPMMELMQLVFNETSHSTASSQALTHHDVREQVLPVLKNHFSPEILRYVHVVPFISLEQFPLEKIIRSKLNDLVKSIYETFGIELTYAAEVVKFLTFELIKQNTNAEPMEKLFDQYVRSRISNEILATLDDNNRSKHLSLLLDDLGHQLRCEFVKTHEVSLYKYTPEFI